MIFANGRLLPDSQLSQVLEELEEAVNETRACRTLEPETVISALQAVGERLDRGELDPLILRYAGPGGRREVAHIRPLLRREALEYKLAVELGIPLYSFQERPFGRTQTVPLGTLFHVTAGNVDGLPAFSAVEGLLTGNINLVKLPSGDQGLSLAVFQLLTEQEPRLAPFLYAFQIPSRDTAALRRLADLADGAVVWGGDGAVTALRQLAPPGCKLMEWGHRLSFAYLSRWEGEEDALSALAEHLIQTGGLLCSSCQVIFLDTDALGEGEAFCRSFVPLLERAADRFRAALGEKGEGSLYAWETRLEHAADRLPGTLFPGRGCSLTLREDRELELSPPPRQCAGEVSAPEGSAPCPEAAEGPSPDRGVALSGPGPARPHPAPRPGRSDPDRPAGQHVPHSLRGGTRRGIPPAAVRPDGGHPGAVPGPPHLTVDTN